MIQSRNKSALIIIALGFYGFSNAQVAINNVNPQGIFHVDGAKDNPATGLPTTAQQANDFVVKADGKVGIGTTSPQTKLDLVTAANSTGLQHTDGTIRFQTFLGRGATNGNTDAGWLGTYTNHPLDFMTNNYFRMRITADGNVGIGTTAPTAKLTINTTPGGLTNPFVIGINNCGGFCGQGTPSSIALFNGNSNNHLIGGLDFIPSQSATALPGAGIWGMDRDATNNYAGLQFYTRNASGYDARLTLRSSGNVGIGTNDPQARLHISTTTVNGGLQLQDGSQGAGKVLTSDAQGKASWTILPTTTASVLGTINTTERTVASNTLINSSITLPTGRWLIYVGQLIKATEAATADKNFWMRIVLSNSNTSSNSTTGFSFLGSNTVSGWTSMMKAGYNAFSFLSGVIPVQVTAPTTLYTWFGTCDTGPGGKPSDVNVGNNSENYLFAVPIN